MDALSAGESPKAFFPYRFDRIDRWIEAMQTWFRTISMLFNEKHPFMARVLVILFLVSVFPFSVFSAVPKEAENTGEGCPGCHKGIESINEKMAAAWGADHRCEVCHQGDPAGATKLQAHAGLIANPGDFRVIERTCGKCHSDYGEVQNLNVGGIDNHVGRMLRSVMTTAAGEIAGTRYLWNEQKTRSALYGTRAVIDLDRERPPGAVDRLNELLPATASDAEHLLRSACLRCHLWTEDKTSPGVYRSAGCTACHMLYDQNGLSWSADPTIPKDEPGHPLKHEITTSIPTAQCLMCHNDGGARIGLSYTGLSVTDSTLERKQAESREDTTFGAYVVNVPPDVHFSRGMDCIDCHDSIDVHGDGNIYSHQEFQVGIRCETCHGSATAPPDFRTVRGNRLRRISIEGGKPYLLTKILQEKKPIPVISEKTEFGWLPDIWHEGHQQLECYACHSTTAPQCYACHLTRDDSKISPADWAAGVGEKQPPKPVPGAWTGRKLLQQWFDPVLGINYRRHIAPLIPGGQSFVTHAGSDGAIVESKKTFTTAGGLYGFSMNPVQPHTTSSKARSCSSCHSSSKALGLGTAGLLDLKRHGLPIAFPPDQVGDENGIRVQDSPHEGVRAFTGEELRRIYRTESCSGCHKEPVNRTVEPDLPQTLKGADEMHQKLIELLVSPKEE
jgi:hypothetical protein